MSTSLIVNPANSPSVRLLHNLMLIYCFSLIKFHFESCDFQNYKLRPLQLREDLSQSNDELYIKLITSYCNLLRIFFEPISKLP